MVRTIKNISKRIQININNMVGHGSPIYDRRLL